MMERVPVQPVKRSSRFENSDTPMMTKAKKLKDYKDNAGTNFNPFTTLQDISNVNLENMAVECGIVL